MNYTCPRCQKQVTHEDLASGGGNQCVQCAANEVIEAAQARQSMMIVQQLNPSKVDRLLVELRSAGDIRDIMPAVLKELGGLEEFASEWARHIRYAGNHSPGSKAVLDGFMGIAKLCAEVTKITMAKEVDDGARTTESLEAEYVELRKRIDEQALLTQELLEKKPDGAEGP